jgi:malate synthase
MIVNAVNCGAKVFMADFEDSNTPTFDNLVTGQLNLRNGLLREIDFSTPGAREFAERKATVVPATGAQLMARPARAARCRWPRRWPPWAADARRTHTRTATRTR